MRLSQTLFQTLRQTTESGSSGQDLLRRAGYLRDQADWLPLGRLLHRRLLDQLAEKLEAVNARETNLQLQAGTHARLARLSRTVGGMVASHRQLPQVIRQSGRSPDSQAELFEAVAFAAAGSDREEAAFRQLMGRASRSTGVRLLQAAAGPGRTAFVQPEPAGQEALFGCGGCGTLELAETARFQRETPEPAEPLPLQETETPGADTIAALAEQLRIPATGTAKAVFLKAQPETEARLIIAVLRGDMQLSEAKLGHALGLDGFRPATEAEIRRAGAEPGYGSPVGLRTDGVLVVIDEAVAGATNLVAGANRPGWHFLNTNAGRDYEPEVTADLARAEAGAPCPGCGQPLQEQRGTVFGRVVAVPAEASSRAGLTYKDTANHELPVAVTMLELDVSALLVAAAALNSDDAGLVWPRDLAPFEVVIVPLGKPGSQSLETAERVCGELAGAGVRVLLDDRTARAGVKFNDADLIGSPFRLTVGDRGLESGQLEGKWRQDGKTVQVPLEGAAEQVLRLLRN